MKHFVLFSMILIVASVIVLLMPQNENENEQEGITLKPMPETTRKEGVGAIINQMGQGSAPPIPATFFRESSITAAAADGTSDQDQLLHNTLKKQERLFETFTTKSNMDPQSVSATTTKKNGIASTSSSTIEAFTGPKCNPKCVPIINTSDAIGGNCVNPKLPDNNPDYSKKYCPAFRPPDGDPLMREQECMTCGYYKYAANCIKHADPNDPKKCTLYGSYDYEHPTTGSNNYMKCNANDPICNLFYGVGNNDGGDGTTTNTGPTCSAANCAPKEVNVAGSKCVIPGCISMDDGMLPYPMGFYGSDQINPCTGKGANGIKCPAITSGTMYDSAGGSNDPCYTTNGTIDKTKFQSMNQAPICNRVKPISQQNFIPQAGQDTQGQDTQDTQGQDTQDTQGQSDQGIQVINVYHHRGKKNGSMSNSNNSSSSDSSTYVDPVPGTLYIGIF